MKKEINFRRITSPKGKDFERLWKIYEKCFPIRDEREVKRNILGITKGHPHEDGEKYVESFLLSVNVNCRPIGGAIFDYVEDIAHGTKLSFGIDWYLFIEKECRMKGMGKQTHEECLKILQDKARQRGLSLDLIVCEMNDLRRMRPEDREKDRKVIIDPGERMAFFSSLGYHEIDHSRFRYVQPQLAEDRHPCRELMLAIKPIGKDFHNRVPGEYLKRLLWLYTWAGFDGIPGSNIKGHRNPDTDRAYKEMKSQLERMRKPLGLERLVSSPDIRIEPLSKRTLEPAIRLLNSIFSYEKEVPDISLRASLNPKPYRKYLNEWKIPELRYWVALSKSKKVIGTVGLYSYKKDRKEASWLGWFSVSPGYRKQGVGTKLLDFAIYNAKLKGKRYLRLYTSDNPNELAAHKLYEKTGFVKTGEEPQKGKDKKIFYRLDLRK